MPEDMSKGGDAGAPRNQGNPGILLVGNYARDADVLRRELTFITGLSYTAWYCSDLDEALIFLASQERSIAIIFIDLSLFTGSVPKERFLHVRQRFQYTPIIALTDQASDHLTRYAMENGATDNVSRSQIRGEQEYLRRVLESCFEQNKTVKSKDRNCLVPFRAANDQDEHLRQGASADRAAILEAVNIRLLLDGGSPLLGNGAPGEGPRAAGTGNIQSRGKEEQGKSDILLHQIKEKDAFILNISEENAQLRKDLHQSGVDLNESHLRGDAILKYAQDKGAIELKTARNEIKELHKDLLQAKEGLRDGQPLNPPAKE